MKNTFTTPTNFWHERDFGAKISATFEFISAHWRTLGKCLMYFVLPFTLLMGIGLGFFTNSMFDQMSGAMAGKKSGWHSTVGAHTSSSPFGMFNFGGMALAFIAGMLAFLLLTGTVFGYLRARLRLPANQPVTPAEVWAEVRARLGRMVLVIMLLVGGYVVVVLGAVMLIGVLASTGGGGSFASAVLGFPLVGALVVYLAVVLSLFFPVLWLEDNSLMGTLLRCFQLIKGRWWATFGLIAVVGIIQSSLSIVFIIPQYAVMFGKMLHVPGLDSDLLGILAQCIYAAGIIFTYTIPLLALSFQYFNLAEQKEGVGLRLLVNELGQAQTAPVAQSSHYRPDDEGEY
jgi:hypothetical protein